ncbi:unnamed protein product [Staurois parvus]|uniref:Uncharacterized protein n=1 Tax=Staurois parvus TaxID=386267 RepID=A0ABN9BFE5_9NEOB|nr:unnamed protein product [Staurois parvus]
MLLPRSRVCHGSLYGLPLLRLYRHTLPCATFRSPHTALRWFPFCHRVLYGLPLLLPPPPHCGYHTLVLAPVTAQMSEVCVILNRRHSSACHTELTVLFLPSSPTDSNKPI